MRERWDGSCWRARLFLGSSSAHVFSGVSPPSSRLASPRPASVPWRLACTWPACICTLTISSVSHTNSHAWLEDTALQLTCTQSKAELPSPSGLGGAAALRTLLVLLENLVLSGPGGLQPRPLQSQPKCHASRASCLHASSW